MNINNNWIKFRKKAIYLQKQPGKNNLHGWSEWSQQVEAADDDESKEDSVVVEDGESGSFVIGNFIFLPQNPTNKTNEKVYID